MNIKPTSTDSVPQPMPPAAKPLTGKHAIKHALHEFLIEEFQPDQFQTISEAWKNNPEVRPSVLEAAKQLAADPNYPTPAQLHQLAQMIVDGRQITLPPTNQPPGLTEPPVTEPPMTEPPMTEPPISATDLS